MLCPFGAKSLHSETHAPKSALRFSARFSSQIALKSARPKLLQVVTKGFDISQGYVKVATG